MRETRKHCLAARPVHRGKRSSLIVAALFLASATLVACAETAGTAAAPDSGARFGQGHEMLNALLWQKSSAEYEVLARQSFAVARQNLDQAMTDPGWTAALAQSGPYAHLPPAIVLDLDETVLDNTPYEERIVRVDGEFGRDGFQAWCEEASAPAVPGAQEFLRYADGRGVAVFYVSARSEAQRACTLANLERIGLPLHQGSDRLLLRATRGKNGHRAHIARDFRILLLVGDSLEDFVEGSKATPEQRRQLARSHADRWGKQWIMLPNPIYGHWEAAWFDFDYGMPRSEKLTRKLRGLQATR